MWYVNNVSLGECETFQCGYTFFMFDSSLKKQVLLHLYIQYDLLG